MKGKYLKDPKIFYRKSIINKGPTLFFVHGVWGCLSAWKPYEKEFSKNYNVISISLRGHGKSFRPRKIEDYSIDKFAEDIYNIIKKEKIKEIIPIGNSYGNFVILEFLRKCPKLAKNVILISPHYNIMKIGFVKYNYLLAKILYSFRFLFPHKEFGNEIDYSKFMNRYNSDWDMVRLIPDFKNTGFRTSLILLKKSYDFNAEEFYRDLNHNFLIIHGDKDTVFPIEQVKQMASDMENCEIKIINDANHTMPLNNYVELKDSIHYFLKNKLI